MLFWVMETVDLKYFKDECKAYIGKRIKIILQWWNALLEDSLIVKSMKAQLYMPNYFKNTAATLWVSLEQVLMFQKSSLAIINICLWFTVRLVLNIVMLPVSQWMVIQKLKKESFYIERWKVINKQVEHVGLWLHF